MSNTKYLIGLVMFLIVIIVAYDNMSSRTPPVLDKKGTPRAEQLQKSVEQSPSKPLISRSKAQAKLNELSAGLNVRYDDMKEVTFCHCPINYDIHPSIYIVPYAVVDKNYGVSLRQDILYTGREPLYFNELYVKTSDGVETFKYEKTVKSVNGGYFAEEYVGLMEYNLYKKLQTAIEEGRAKFRLEGRTFGERELTQRELSDMSKVFALYEFFNSVEIEN